MEGVSKNKIPGENDTENNITDLEWEKMTCNVTDEAEKDKEIQIAGNKGGVLELQGTSHMRLNDIEEASSKSQLERLEMRFQMQKMNPKTLFCLNYLTQQIPNLATDFDICRKLGEGSFSTVYLVSVKPSAMHKIPGHFPHLFAMKYFKSIVPAKWIDNEIRLLKHIGGGDNTVLLYSYMRSGACTVLLMQYMQHDNFYDAVADMSIEESRVYMYNLFIALRKVHSCGVIHRDIKPNNFLYNRKEGHFLLVDFGLSAFVNSTTLNNTVAGTRGFQAPEILLKYSEQTPAIDMWAAGVIMICILSKTYPFFFQSSTGDLSELMKVFGTENIISLAKSFGTILQTPDFNPPLDLCNLCERLRSRRSYYGTIPKCTFCKFEIDKQFGGCPCLKPGQTSTLGTEIPPMAYDLLKKLLDINPATRITAQQALNHPFIKGQL